MNLGLQTTELVVFNQVDLCFIALSLYLKIQTKTGNNNYLFAKI